MFKSYSSKSSALKGAKRSGFDASVVQEIDGVWGFEVPTDAEVATYIDTSVAPVEEVANATEVHPALTEAGFTVSETGATVPAPEISKKRTIEKDREMQHGVKRPSIGGMCRAVWDWCDAAVTPEGTIPTAKQVKEAAALHNWNPNNASIEYYNWRKFMGVRARATTLPDLQVQQ